MSSFVDSAEFERLLERITADDASLTTVNLVFKRIGDAGAIRLAEALRGNTNVTRLYLSWSSIGDDGARALADALQHNSTLTLLGLPNNSISDDGARALAEVLRTNSAIATLQLGDNRIGDDGVRALADALTLNCTLKYLGLYNNSIGDEGGRALLELLQMNSCIAALVLGGNDIDDDLATKIRELAEINYDAPNPEEAHRLKIERRIGWMLDSEGGLEYEAAVTLGMAELESFPEPDRRRGLFKRLLGSAERGVDVAASVDTAGGRALYWYAAECVAAPGVLMNLLHAHPSLCVCRDVKEKLYPFMLLATMSETGACDVMEALLLSPSLVKGGISQPNAEGQE